VFQSTGGAAIPCTMGTRVQADAGRTGGTKQGQTVGNNSLS